MNLKNPSRLVALLSFGLVPILFLFVLWDTLSAGCRAVRKTFPLCMHSHIVQPMRVTWREVKGK